MLNQGLIRSKCLRSIPPDFYQTHIIKMLSNKMKSRQQTSKTSQKNKTEETTVSTEQERVTTSLIRMINSENLTLEMAVNYLFEWRKNSKILGLLLERIRQFCSKKSVHYIPTIIFIMTLDYHEEFFTFCQQLAHSSLPLYLMVRWSYSAYWGQSKKDVENMKNKLDSSLIGKYKFTNQQQFDLETFQLKIKEKQNYSNYLSVLNDYFDRLFKIPEKLKKYQKVKRNDKLKSYLNKMTSDFMKDQNGYLNGVAYPIEDNSVINVRFLPEYCFTFSTKQRVPFKLVFETISQEDAIKCRNGIFPTKSESSLTVSQHKNYKSLIMPQTYFGQLWEHSEQKIKSTSPYSQIPSYKIRSFMVKSGDDLRQQYMAMQLIKLVEDIIIKENLKMYIRSYSVIPFNSDSGLIQFVPNTRTVSYLKEKSKEKSLRKIYQQIFGVNWEESIMNFIQSLAGYSLIQYLFQIKDRHNNNILIDTAGHMIHIDFSFMLSSSPGNMGFERAPFKFTQDYVQLMEGKDSDIFQHFKMLFFLGLKYLRKYKKQIMETVTMMQHCEMKCFAKFQADEMEKRFHSNSTDEQLQHIVDQIVTTACSSYSTSHYDRYQWYTNFIYS